MCLFCRVQILLDYVIVALSEIKTAKGVFTYYIITEGGAEVGLVMADAN